MTEQSEGYVAPRVTQRQVIGWLDHALGDEMAGCADGLSYSAAVTLYVELQRRLAEDVA